MNQILLIFTFCVTSFISRGQTGLDSTSYDFWVGDWVLTWKNADGTISKGTNTIAKILDGRVIQEHFEDEKGFKGTSITVYNTKQKTWRQAWADNQGGYFNFNGAVEDGNFVFKTQPVERDGMVFIQKMVFRHVKSDGFTWDWMGSQDGGQNWRINWQIFYTKK